MKSVLQAGWLLTVAFGNVIVLIVAEGAGLEQVWGLNYALRLHIKLPTFCSQQSSLVREPRPRAESFSTSYVLAL